MRALSSLVLCLVLATPLGACGSPFDDENPNPGTVEFLDGQFSILRPARWSLLADLNDEADLQMGNLRREAYCIVLSEAKMDFDDGVTLHDFSDLTRGSLVDSLEDLSVKGPEDLHLGVLPAVRYELLGSADAQRIKYWHVCVDGGAYFHQVILWSLPSKFERNRMDFQSVLDSIAATD